MVRATFSGFTTALSAMQANQKRLNITGQNLSNMNTVGYTRQQLKVSSLNYTNPISHYMNGSEISVGFGVHMDTVTRIRDPFLDVQYRNQMDRSGYTNGLQTSLDRLANFFDESHITGIQKAFDDIQSTLTNIHDTAKVNDPIFEAELRSRMEALTNLLNQGAKDIEDAKMEEFNRLDGTGTSEQGAIQRVNDILQQIGSLNRQIKENQIHGQPSLELMDNRDVLLDELSSYLPIEVTYRKDEDHDGIDAAGNEDLSELYHLDSSGRPIMRKEWPDDLYVTMQYIDETGKSQTLKLVEGTVGVGEENHLKLEIPNTKDILDTTNPAKPGDVKLDFYALDEKGNKAGAAVLTFEKDTTTNPPKITNQFPSDSGSIQAGLDMLWKDGTTDGLNDVKGYDFYMKQLDRLASVFAEVINTLNIQGTTNSVDNKPLQNYFLLANKEDGTSANITAANIGINSEWVNGNVHISKSGDNHTDTVLHMLEAMKATYPYDNLKDFDDNPLFDKVNLDNNTFANFMNHTSTILANDSYSNKIALKTNVTVLNGIENSRDSVSGVSLDEEASNMMMYMSAYNAASRLMTTMDQALDILINSTGVVGR